MIFRTKTDVVFLWLLFCFQFPKNYAQSPLETGVSHSPVGLGALPSVPGRLHLLLPVKALGKVLNSPLEGSESAVWACAELEKA